MFKLARFATPVLLGLAVSPLALHAQATVNSGGNLSIKFSDQASHDLAQHDISVVYVGASPIHHGEDFNVSGGSVRLRSGVGSVSTFGSVALTEGSDTVTLGQLALEGTNGNSYITAEVFVASQDMGRYPVFLLDSNLFSAPLSHGKYKSGPVGFRINPAFQSEYSDQPPIADLDPNAELGNFALTVTISRSK